MYSAQSDDKVVQCPFNRHHLISSSRLQRHIVKCEKNYPQDYNVMCPYNASHRLKKWEIEEHIEKCPTRTIIEASQIPESSANSTRSQEECSSMNYRTDMIADGETTWDEGEMRMSRETDIDLDVTKDRRSRSMYTGHNVEPVRQESFINARSMEHGRKYLF